MDNKLPRTLPKPWLLTRKEFDAVDTYGDHLPVCRAQHVKTLEWLEAQQENGTQKEGCVNIGLSLKSYGRSYSPRPERTWEMDLLIRLREGEAVPFGYGYAWREFSWRYTVVMPMPLNWIAAGVRSVYHWILSLWWSTALDKRMDSVWHEAFHEGFGLGYRQGETAGRFLQPAERDKVWREGYDHAFHALSKALLMRKES